MFEAISSLGGLAPIVAVVVVFAVLIVLFLKWVLAYMEKKDTRFLEHINEKDRIFTEIVTNHLSDDKKMQERLINAFTNVEKAIERFLNQK